MSIGTIPEFRLLGSKQKIESGSGETTIWFSARCFWRNERKTMDDPETYGNAVTLIDQAVNAFLNALADKQVKLAVADVLRLLDLRKQLAHDEIREVRATWVDSDPAPFA